jgi:hypothetical protein
MSDAAPLAATAPRPWSNVVARTAMIAAIVTMIGWVFVADYDRIFGGGHVPWSRGKVFSAEWAISFAGVFIAVVPCALAFAVLLSTIMARAERDRVRSPLYWELAGFAAAAPLLLWAWWVLFWQLAPLGNYVLALIAIGLLSLFGSNSARKARHGRAR